MTSGNITSCPMSSSKTQETSIKGDKKQKLKGQEELEEKLRMVQETIPNA